MVRFETAYIVHFAMRILTKKPGYTEQKAKYIFREEYPRFLAIYLPLKKQRSLINDSNNENQDLKTLQQIYKNISANAAKISINIKNDLNKFLDNQNSDTGKLTYRMEIDKITMEISGEYYLEQHTDEKPIDYEEPWNNVYYKHKFRSTISWYEQNQKDIHTWIAHTQPAFKTAVNDMCNEITEMYKKKEIGAAVSAILLNSAMQMR